MHEWSDWSDTKKIGAVLQSTFRLNTEKNNYYGNSCMESLGSTSIKCDRHVGNVDTSLNQSGTFCTRLGTHFLQWPQNRFYESVGHFRSMLLAYQLATSPSLSQIGDGSNNIATCVSVGREYNGSIFRLECRWPRHPSTLNTKKVPGIYFKKYTTTAYHKFTNLKIKFP